MKTLLIVSVDKKVNNFLRTIMHNIIGSEVRVVGQSIEEGAARPILADVIMTSGAFLVPRTRSIYLDRPVIAPRRLITGQNLEKVLMLRRGTAVLVVNHPRSATEETIDSLRNLGINHIEYVPYWKGCKKDLSSFSTAITPGMSHLCPPGVEHVIDIGPRIISLHSFLELLLALGLDLSYLENFATYYHNFLMEASRKLAAVLEQSELLRQYQEIILDQFEDGLLSVNETGGIDLANRAIARLVKKGVDSLLGSNIDEVLQGFEHTASLMDESSSEGGSSSLYEYDGRQILVQKIPVTSDNRPRFVFTFREVARIQRLEKDVRIRLAHKGHITKYGFSDLWSISDKIRQLQERALNFAVTEKNILITGESGTGKELFAHAIHQSSPRREGPFVAINFAGIPESLVESELFGYEAGAFTGAKKGGKVGLFEQAHGGTIFLDEIGDAPLNVQSRLLRVLQEKEIMKVGGSKITPIDVRIIAGTNRNLHEAMQQGKFRTDLYYRLNTLPLEIPPLREHKEDIMYILQRYLLEKHGIRKEYSPDVERCLIQYQWPGNIRELINLADYLSISSRTTPVIHLEHLPRSLVGSFQPPETTKQKAPDEDFDRLVQWLEKSIGNLDIVRSILELLENRKGEVCGRNSLIRGLVQAGYPMTEGRMKRMLLILRTGGLIHVGSTKQGSTLTRKGRQFIDHLRFLCTEPQN